MAHTKTKRNPHIVGLKITNLGPYVTILCQDCSREFERFQPTVAGMALARHICPGCQSVIQVTPHDLEKALNRYAPVRNPDAIKEEIGLASILAESWYRSEPYREYLTYHDMNLGEAAELGLLPCICQVFCATKELDNKE